MDFISFVNFNIYKLTRQKENFSKIMNLVLFGLQDVLLELVNGTSLEMGVTIIENEQNFQCT